MTTGSFSGPRSARPMNATTVGATIGMTSAPSSKVAEPELKSRGSDAILPAGRKNACMIAGGVDACSIGSVGESSHRSFASVAQEPTDQHRTADETADMRDEGDTAGAGFREQRAQELPGEPRSEHDQRRHA